MRADARNTMVLVIAKLALAVPDIMHVSLLMCGKHACVVDGEWLAIWGDRRCALQIRSGVGRRVKC